MKAAPTSLRTLSPPDSKKVDMEKVHGGGVYTARVHSWVHSWVCSWLQLKGPVLILYTNVEAKHQI